MGIVNILFMSNSAEGIEIGRLVRCVWKNMINQGYRIFWGWKLAEM